MTENVHGFESDDEARRAFDELLEERRKADRQKKLKNLLDLGGSEADAQQYDVEPVTTEPAVMARYHMPGDATPQEVAEFMSGREGEAIVPARRTADVLLQSAGFAVGSPEDRAAPERKRRKPTRRQAIIGVSVMSLVLGGGAVAVNTYAPGVVAEASSSDELPTQAATPASTEKSGEMKLAAGDIAVGDCLDENGSGKSLIEGRVSVKADMHWKVKTISGKEIIAKFPVADPKDPAKVVPASPQLTIKDVALTAAACIVPDARAAALAVEGEVVKVNWEKIEPQLGIIPGENLPSTPFWPVEPKPGVIDAATAAALNADMEDSANLTTAGYIARAGAAKRINDTPDQTEHIRTKMIEKMTAEINERVSGLHKAQKSPVAKVKVEFVGAPKPFSYRGPAADVSPKFDVAEINLEGLDVK